MARLSKFHMTPPSELIVPPSDPAVVLLPPGSGNGGSSLASKMGQAARYNRPPSTTHNWLVHIRLSSDASQSTIRTTSGG